MRQTRYNAFTPFRPLNVPHLMDEFSGWTIGDILGTENVTTTPSVNIVENEEAYLIEIAAPGLKKKDFEVKIEDDNLLISVSNNAEAKRYKRREFSYDSFSRKFYLAKDINREAIDARYKLGVLTVSLTKVVDSEEKSKTIEIV